MHISGKGIQVHSASWNGSWVSSTPCPTKNRSSTWIFTATVRNLHTSCFNSFSPNHLFTLINCMALQIQMTFLSLNEHKGPHAKKVKVESWQVLKISNMHKKYQKEESICTKCYILLICLVYIFTFYLCILKHSIQ